MYIHLKSQQNVELVDRLRQEAEEQMALLAALDPPTYEEATLRNPASKIPVSSSGSQDTDVSTTIEVSPPIASGDSDH